ncbi:FAD-dependent oxidoreductase [Duganella sp. BuS-21]|uniref:FAD-dependent oxidoreductase n=1 Tax=Duganella sp. BuS-21 TaxID=2943848 RepID=UPI0035A74339
MITHDVEVLLVGLGPVGSTTALYLARHGISVAAIECAALGATDLRASTFHPPTIEMLDDLGVATKLKTEGLIAPRYQHRDRKTNEVFNFDMGELADITRFPYRIQCEQHRVAHEVAETLALEGTAQVAYHQRLVFMEQDEDGVTAWVETPLAVEKYRAKYVIGADGASSIVRKLLDLDFPGFTYNDKFLCYSTEYPIENAFEGLSHVNYISDPEEWMVLLRVPGLWRVLVPAANDVSDATLLSDATKNELFRRMLKSDDEVVTRHRTIYRVHQRVVSQFAVGRVCLIGDAAHLNSPMGGFGMNSGIHDGINLGEKLVRILRQGGDHALVQQFHRQRHQVTTDFVQTQTIDNTKMMREGPGAARELRRERMAKLNADATLRRAFLKRQAMFTSLEDAAAIV